MKVGWLVFNVNYLALMILFPGFEVLSSKLSNLDLRFNLFNNDKSILSCFNGNLSTLKSLDLSFNMLIGGSGSFYGNLLIIQLRNLFFYHTISFYAFISFQYALEKHHAGFIKVLSSRLKKLENLYLSGNQCNDSIFPSLTGFSSLKSLDLSYNQLTGSGIIQSFYLNASHDILLIILFLYIYLIKTINKTL